MGALFGIVCQVFVSLTEPANPTMFPGDALRLSKDAYGGVMAKMHYYSARSEYCTRQTGEIIFTMDADWDGKKMPGYYSLAFGQNGPGINIGTSDEYVLYRWMPPGLPKGKWTYVMRVRHECAPWGLVHWPYTSPAREIEIP